MKIHLDILRELLVADKEYTMASSKVVFEYEKCEEEKEKKELQDLSEVVPPLGKTNLTEVMPRKMGKQLNG